MQGLWVRLVLRVRQVLRDRRVRQEQWGQTVPLGQLAQPDRLD